MTGNALLYVNLIGGGGGGGEEGGKVKDGKGREWEMKVPGGFRFVYRKVGDGYKLGSTAITSDSGVVVVELLRRGVVKPGDIGL